MSAPLLRQAPLALPTIKRGDVRIPCPAIDHIVAFCSLGLAFGDPDLDLESELDRDLLWDCLFILLATDEALEASVLAGEEEAAGWMAARIDWMDRAPLLDEEDARQALVRAHQQIIECLTEAIQNDMPTDKKDTGPGNWHGPRSTPGTRHESRAQRKAVWAGARSGVNSPTRRGSNSFMRISSGRATRPAGRRNAVSRMLAPRICGHN